MTVKRILASLLSVLMIASMLAGCSAGSDTPPEQSSPSVSSTPASQSPSPTSQSPVSTPPASPSESAPAEPTERTVIDQLGREVVIPYNVTSVVTNHGPSTSFIVAMGGADKIAAVFSEPSERSIYRIVAPHFADLPNIGGSGGGGNAPNAEALAEIKPEVFVFPFGRAENTLPTLDTLGIAGIAVAPEDFDSIIVTMRLLGSVLGTEEHAENAIKMMQDHLAFAQERLAGIDTTVTGVVMGGDTVSVSANQMMQAEILRKAGGVNLAEDVDGSSYTEVGLEQILEWDPEFIFITAWGKLQPEDVLAEPRFANLKAVKNQNVYKIPSDADWWDTATAYSALAVIWVANKMYPDAITADEVEAKVTEYYKLLYGVEVGRDFLLY